MRKDEVLALGVPEERLKDFQNKYHEDLRKAIDRHKKETEEPVRTALNSMLALIHDVDSLRLVLVFASDLYYGQWNNARIESEEGVEE